MIKIKLALAVNQSKIFEEKHFGDAEQFLIYEWAEGQICFEKAILNPLTNNSNGHHSPEKAKKIMSLLTDNHVNVLVSKRFGSNIKKVNASFVPVLIEGSTPEEVFPILEKQMKWIEEEWEYNAGNYKLFNLKKGTIKKTIR